MVERIATEAEAAAARGDIRASIITALANVRACEREEVEAEITESGGDLIVDSQESVVVIAVLEQQIDRELPSIADLDPTQYTSVEGLVTLIVGTAGQAS